MCRQSNLCNAFSSLYVSNIIYVYFTSITRFDIYSQNPEIALSQSKAAEFYRENLKIF